ncbi:MAG: M48 family metalloprotease [Chloroflexi bacterium]|nr:M48 family metalloprotease [Chloroflexota bacterium]
MWLQTRMFLLVALLFGILYGVMVAVGRQLGIGNAVTYIILAFLFLGLQYLISPALVGWTMRVKWVSEKEEPELHRMVAELAANAKLPKPRVGISELNMPNAFAFGRTQRDGRVCVTRGILNLLSKDELRAVLGHELAHIKHRDMAVITLLSAIPMILYWLAWTMMWGGAGNRREGGNYAVLIGIAAFLLYFITNLLVLYGSRIREYYADLGSVQLGNQPHHLATALYKLVYGNARARTSKEEMKRVEGVKAFFVNDPSRAWYELRELSQIDRDVSGTISQGELMEIRQRQVRLGFGDKMLELFTTHPNMLKRIKHLSSLNV